MINFRSYCAHENNMCFDWFTLKEVSFANWKIFDVAVINFCELACLKYVAGINFCE